MSVISLSGNGSNGGNGGNTPAVTALPRSPATDVPTVTAVTAVTSVTAVSRWPLVVELLLDAAAKSRELIDAVAQLPHERRVVLCADDGPRPMPEARGPVAEKESGGDRLRSTPSTGAASR